MLTMLPPVHANGNEFGPAASVDSPTTRPLLFSPRPLLWRPPSEPRSVTAKEANCARARRAPTPAKRPSETESATRQASRGRRFVKPDMGELLESCFGRCGKRLPGKVSRPNGGGAEKPQGNSADFNLGGRGKASKQ